MLSDEHMNKLALSPPSRCKQIQTNTFVNQTWQEPWALDLIGSLPYTYKTFSNTLKPHFLMTFNDITLNNPLPRSFLEAHIVIIPKPEEDSKLCPNYCYISDTKLFTRIMANRLHGILPSIIGLDQVGFAPGREARDSSIKTFTLIYTPYEKCRHQRP